MKILYWTDPHIMGRNPGSRIDSYPDALYKKALEIENVCTLEKPDAMVIGGDLYDSPRIADSIKTKYNKLFRRIRKKLRIPIYLVPGNHDLFGYTMDTIDQTAIGVQASAGVYMLLTRRGSGRVNGIKVAGKDGITVAIHGQEYHKDIDTDPINDYQIQADSRSDWNILFSHGMLLKDPFHPDVRYSLTKDIRTDADMVVNGHYHPGYDIHEINDTIFANPGSTGRDEICKREPQYAIITATADDLEIEYFQYQVAESHTVVFDHTYKAQVQAHERYLEAFEQTIEDAMTFDSFDPKDIIRDLAQAEAIDALIEQLAFDSIVAAESVEKVNKLEGYVEKSKPLAISEIELENFQSHKKTIIKLNETGLNALTGASDSGKSAVIRALRWVLYNDPKGTEFIRHGESRSTVTVRFSDGSSITRSRTNSSAGEYIVRDPHGNEKTFKGFGNDIPIDVANTHQMPRVELSPGVERSLNFSYQLDGHFMLSDTPSSRAATIGRLTGVHIVDAAIREKQKDIRNTTRDFNASEKRVGDLDAKLQAFTDLPVLEDRIRLSNALILAAESHERELEELMTLRDGLNQTKQDVATLENQKQAYDGLVYAGKLIEAAELLSSDITEMTSLRKTWRQSVADVKNLTAELDSFKDMDQAERKLAAAELLSAEVRQLFELKVVYDDALIIESNTERDLKQYAGLAQVESGLTRADNLTTEIAELTTLHNQVVFADKEIDRLTDEELEQQTVQKELQAEIRKILGELGNKCPTCNQDVDAEHLLEHV